MQADLVGICESIFYPNLSFSSLHIAWHFTRIFSANGLYLSYRYRGSYLGEDVAIKVLRSEHLNETVGAEFAQEVMILR